MSECKCGFGGVCVACATKNLQRCVELQRQMRSDQSRVEWEPRVGTPVHNAAGECVGVSGDAESHGAWITVKGAWVLIATLDKLSPGVWQLSRAVSPCLHIKSDHAPLAAAEEMLARMGLLG